MSVKKYCVVINTAWLQNTLMKERVKIISDTKSYFLKEGVEIISDRYRQESFQTIIWSYGMGWDMVAREWYVSYIRLFAQIRIMNTALLNQP